MFMQIIGRQGIDVGNTDICPIVPDMAHQMAIEQALVPPSTVWSGADTLNVFVFSALLVGLASFMQRKGPKWMPKNAGLLSFASLANVGTVVPLGYAAYLVYKLAGGMIDTETHHGIFLYGLTLLLIYGIGKIATTKYTDHKMIVIGGLATTVLAGWTAYAFYKINDTAAYLMLPFTVWMWNAICTVPWVIAKWNEHKMANAVDIGQQRKTICMDVVVWTEVLGFVKRIQLARTVSLTNLQIYQICWPRLHGNKVEARRIRSTSVIRRQRSDPGHPPKALVYKHDEAIPLFSCPPPPYISGFDELIIRFLDQQVLEFFTHIVPLLAKTGVYLSLHFDGPDAKLVAQLLNILKDGMPANQLDICCPIASFQYLPEIDNKMEQICLWVRDTAVECDISFFVKMLAFPRPDGQQRVIYLSDTYGGTILNAIKEDFRTATRPLPQPFYISISFYQNANVPSAETNEKTNEQLTIMPTPNPTAANRVNNLVKWEICRHPRGQHEQWAEDGRKRVQPLSWDTSRIRVELDNA